MHLQSIANTQLKRSKALASAKKKKPEAPSGSGFKDVVTKGAYASGGALAGVGLGVVTGAVLSNLTGNTSMMTVGGALGALGGAGTGLSVVDSDSKGETIKKVVFGWGGASVGATAGQYIIGHGLGAVATAAGLPILATTAPLIGTAVGGLVGSSLPLIGSDSKAANLLKATATTGAGGTAGLAAGTVVRLIGLENPLVAHLGTVGPVLGLATGAAIGLAINNKSKPAKAAASTLGVSSIGYLAGTAAGAGLQALGLSPLYTVALPVIGAATGALQGYSNVSGLKGAALAGKVASTGFSGTIGTVVGDFAGGKLADLTNVGLYHPVGLVAGGVGAALLALEGNGVDTKGAARIVNTASVMGAVGAVGGHILSNVTGLPIYNLAGGALGALNGAAIGAHGSGIDLKGGEVVLGTTTVGTGIAALLGAGMTAATGNPVFNVVSPLLGAANGALIGAQGIGIDTKKSAQISLMSSVGFFTGTLAGVALTKITGHDIYSDVGTVAGLANGALLGTELATDFDSKGAFPAIVGASAGTAVGALLGAALTNVTGQGLWGVAVPLLGATAGALSGLVASFGREDSE